MNMKDITKSRYLRYLMLPTLFGTERTKEILNVNPTIIPQREEAKEVCYSVFDYDANVLEERKPPKAEETFIYRDNSRVSWINIDGLRKSDVETICNHFGIHPLL